MKLLDKSSFFMGVTSLLTTEFILLHAPEHFWAWCVRERYVLHAHRHRSARVREAQARRSRAHGIPLAHLREAEPGKLLAAGKGQ